MPKDFWINISVKNLEKSKAFFRTIGFIFNEDQSHGEQMACLLMGEKQLVLMLFAEPFFQNFTKNEATDCAKSNEVLFSIGAESREEVDDLMQKVVAAGGTIYAPAGENQGWMYGGGFVDLDGHRWNPLFMDMEKMPKQG
jgi:uncharacterized protein